MNEILLRTRMLAACTIAREAGRLVRTRFKERSEVLDLHFKGPQDYLTATDGEVERLIASRLAESFPDDAFFGEEGGGARAANVWIVDPIDGTADFARGVAYFCVSMAFVVDGRTEIGVVYDPMADELFAAQRSCGATLDGRPIHVSSIDDPKRSVIEAGWSPRAPFEDYVKLLTRLNALGAGVKRRGSGALGQAYVAAGRQDAYCELHINAWDAAAAVLLIEEAGGWVNDFLTSECLERGNRVIGCTPGLRDAIVAAMDI